MKTSNESRKRRQWKTQLQETEGTVLCLGGDKPERVKPSLYIKYNIGLKIALKGIVLQ